MDSPSAKDSPRIVVFAYSNVGHACLQCLIHKGAPVVGVFTHEDDPGENLWFPSVAQLASRHGIPVFKPESLKEEETFSLIRDELRPSLILSFYYRKLIPTRILKLASLGAYNMHGSWLPFYRGKAPVNWAILRGESFTGATLHVMVKEPDAGDIVDQEKVPIGLRETAAQVMEKVKDAAVVVLGRQLHPLLLGQTKHTPQDTNLATCFGGRRPEDGRIDWTQPAPRIFNLIRAVTRPYPGAFSDDLIPGRRCRIWWAEIIPATDNNPPGKVLQHAPLLIACGDNTALRITDYEEEDM